MKRLEVMAAILTRQTEPSRRRRPTQPRPPEIHQLPQTRNRSHQSRPEPTTQRPQRLQPGARPAQRRSGKRRLLGSRIQRGTHYRVKLHRRCRSQAAQL